MKSKGIFNEYNGASRILIQKYCEENKISSSDFRFVNISKWEDIYDKIVDNFADKSKYYLRTLHWVNTNISLKKGKEVICSFDSNFKNDWVLNLPELTMEYDDMAYFVIEQHCQSDKCWISEGRLSVIARIINEGFYETDYYIVDRKYKWMITCNHHGFILFIGEGFNMDAVKNVCSRYRYK